MCRTEAPGSRDAGRPPMSPGPTCRASERDRTANAKEASCAAALSRAVAFAFGRQDGRLQEGRHPSHVVIAALRAERDASCPEGYTWREVERARFAAERSTRARIDALASMCHDQATRGSSRCLAGACNERAISFASLVNADPLFVVVLPVCRSATCRAAVLGFLGPHFDAQRARRHRRVPSGRCVACSQRALTRCAGCLSWYCSRECQLRDWSCHARGCPAAMGLAAVPWKEWVVRDGPYSFRLVQRVLSPSPSPPFGPDPGLPLCARSIA